MQRYKTFIRSVTSWKDFSKARKITQSTGLSYDEARAQCEHYNASRDSRQIRRGTKMEFTAE